MLPNFSLSFSLNCIHTSILLLFIQGAVILLLGTKDDLIESEPIERPKFIEDMNESELASAVCN